MLRFRRDHRTVFEAGSYEPLSFEGARRDHLFGFVRRHEDHHVFVIVPRLVATLMPDADQPPLGDAAWGDTRILLPEGGTEARFRNVFTNTCATVHRDDGRAFLRASEVFEHFPVTTTT